MKKSLFLIIISLALFSCSPSSNKSDSTVDNSLLFRKWFCVSESNNGKTHFYPICPNNGHRDYLEFISPNIVNYYYVDSSSYSICSDVYATASYTFTKTGNIIIEKANGNQIEKLEILELTSTSLKFIETSNGGGSSLFVYAPY